MTMKSCKKSNVKNSDKEQQRKMLSYWQWKILEGVNNYTKFAILFLIACHAIEMSFPIIFMDRAGHNPTIDPTTYTSLGDIILSGHSPCCPSHLVDIGHPVVVSAGVRFNRRNGVRGGWALL